MYTSVIVVSFWYRSPSAPTKVVHFARESESHGTAIVSTIGTDVMRKRAPASNTQCGIPIPQPTPSAIFFPKEFAAAIWSSISVQDLSYHAPSGRLIAATHGRGIYELAAATPVAAVSPVPDAMELDQSYPNPGSTITTIRYTIPASGSVRLEITNAQGKRVALLVEQFENAGIHALPFDVSTLPGGVYFCRLSMGEKQVTRKLVVLR